MEVSNADPIDPILTKDDAFQGVGVLGILGGSKR